MCQPTYLLDPSFRVFVESLEDPCFIFTKEEEFLDFATKANENLGWNFLELSGKGYRSYDLNKSKLEDIFPVRKLSSICLDWVNAKGRGYCYVVLTEGSPKLIKKELQDSYLTVGKGTLIPAKEHDELAKVWVGEGSLHLHVVVHSIHDYVRLTDRLSYSELRKSFRRVTWSHVPKRGAFIEEVDLRFMELTDLTLDKVIWRVVEKMVESNLKVKTQAKVIKNFRVKEGGKVLEIWGMRVISGNLRREDLLWKKWSAFKILNLTIKGVEIQVARQDNEVGVLLSSDGLNHPSIELGDSLVSYEDPSFISHLITGELEK